MRLGSSARVTAVSLALAGFALGVGGCDDGGEDPLAVETLQRVARAQGDAVGQGFAGVYALAGEPGPCDCPEVENLGDLCAILNVDVPVLPATVSHYDGLVVVEIGGTIALIGAVEADGAFATASILNAGLIGADGDLLSRFDGSFDGEGGVQGELVTRLVADFFGEAIDCRASSTLTNLSL
ncbi:MAG: hypothetical protein KC486_04680 [Myxococcales bacterium]|nr:hypothetical protein [Myxococcales bacterium]